MKFIRFAAAILAAGLVMPAAALAGTICPSFVGDPILNATGCNDIIIVNFPSTITYIYPEPFHPFDGLDDQLVGVINNTDSPISSIMLSNIRAIFAFDLDGIDTFGIAGNPLDVANGNTGYGGGNAYFTGINAAKTSGTVNFVIPIMAGSTSYFSVEDIPGLPRSPEPSTFVLLGTGALGLIGGLRRRFLRR
jgi:hypothetical protein